MNWIGQARIQACESCGTHCLMTLNQLSQLIPSNDVFLMRLRISRRRRTKLPSALYCSCGKWAWQPNSAFKLPNVPGMFFCSSFNATKSPATFYSMAYLVTYRSQRSARAEIIWPGPIPFRSGKFQTTNFPVRPVTYSAWPVFYINVTCHNSVIWSEFESYSHTNLTLDVLYWTVVRHF